MGKRLYRSRQEKVLAGICGGLGEYFEVDPTIMRLALVLLAFVTSGLAIPAYLLGWIIIPREPLPGVVQPASAQQAPRAAENEQLEPKREKSAFMRILPGALLVLFGLIALGNHLWWWRWSHLVPIALIFLGLYLILRNWDNSRSDEPSNARTDTGDKPANDHNVSQGSGNGGATLTHDGGES
ncbi:MAG: PspC domain-containing protein [Candidatus Zixiibacteriota bacterium]